MLKGRIIEEHKTNYRVNINGEVYTGIVRGSFFESEKFPKVGDYVECTQADDEQVIIEEILPRSSQIVRIGAGTGEEQVIVSNVDIIFIVMGLDGDYNINRLNRYLELAKQSRLKSVVILNKSDKAEDLDAMVAGVEAVAGDSPVHTISALNQENMEVFTQYIQADTTAVLLGSSGAGKSTITNYLIGEDLIKTQSVREDDDRGKHTTTSRQLHQLPTGGYLIDTPGMRELGLVEDIEPILEDAYFKVSAIVMDCKFSNCDHEKSAGCAVLKAIEAGDITEKDFQTYLKTLKEQEYADSKASRDAELQYKNQQKKLYQKHERIRKRKYDSQ